MTSNLIDSILFVLDFGTLVSTTRIRKYAFIDDSQCLLELYTMDPSKTPSATKVKCTYTKSVDKSFHRYTILDSSKRLEVTVTLGPLDGQIKVTGNENSQESSAFLVSRSQTLDVSQLFDMPQALSLSIAPSKCGTSSSCFASVPGQPESLYHLNIESLLDSNALMYMKTMARCLMQPLRYRLSFIEPCVSYLSMDNTVHEAPNEIIIVWTHSGRQLKATCFANKSFVIRVNSVDIGPDNGIDCSLFTHSVSKSIPSKVGTNTHWTYSSNVSSRKKQARLY
jgi:hypothetical protein